MSDLEKKLNNLKIKKLSNDEKGYLWLDIVYNKEKENSILLLINFKKYMVGGLIALLIVLGGGGAVAASNASVPGDTLFGLDLAVEKARLSLASSDEKKNELRVKFAKERIAETEQIVRETKSFSVRDNDLSGANVTEIEVDVFTNETTVKVEANDRHYGFVTAKKEREEIIGEIKEKYNLTDEQIEAVINFETEDRDSRADDREFLNSANSVFRSEKQKREWEGSLSDINSLLDDSSLTDEEKEEIRVALAELQSLLEENPNVEIKIRTQNGTRIEIEDGEIEIKTKSDSSNSSKSKDNPSANSRGGDIRESADEVFCRGEWRDPEDCNKVNISDDDDDGHDDSDGDDDDSDDDDNNNSGSGNSYDDDDDYHGNNSGSGSSDDDDDSDDDDEDDDSDDDNSGSGNSHDDDDDDRDDD